MRSINVSTPVRYFRRDEGGVSHFKYLRDNLLLAAMYCRLSAALLMRKVSRSSRSWRRETVTNGTVSIGQIIAPLIEISCAEI